MYLLYKAVLVFLALSPFVSASELDYDGWLQVRLWHSFDDGPVPHYTERGNVTISSIRNGAAIVVQPTNSKTNIDKLVSLAEQGGKYRLKAFVRTSSGSETTFLSSVLACHLLGSNLQDKLYIWIDSSAEPVAVNSVSKGPCSLERPLTQMWTTDTKVQYPDGGPIPDTATYIQKLEREKQARESGEVKDNRSFFAKYWMYIVPAIIFFALTSATNPDGPAGGGAGGGGGGGGGGQR